MANIRTSSCFELAFRRALFLLILLAIYLLFGTVLFWIIFQGTTQQQVRTLNNRQEKLDFERTELLNVLWAESISRSEYDWSLLANQKLDVYQKTLSEAVLRHSTIHHVSSRLKIRTFGHSFHHSFILITTIGGVTSEVLTSAAKVLSMLYTIFGIPLVCLFLEQFVRAINALLPNCENSRNIKKAHIGAAIIVLFTVSIVVDIIEQNETDSSFIDVVFGVFLAATTIGPSVHFDVISGYMSSILLYFMIILCIGVFRTTYLMIQHRIERRIGSYEFAFTQKVAQIERVLSMHRLENLVETEEYCEEDSEIVDPATVPSINFREPFLEDNDMNHSVNENVKE